MVNAVIDLFCAVDDFCIEFKNKVLAKLLPEVSASQQRHRPRLCESEIATIVIAFQRSGYRTFKQYYLAIQVNWKSLFPGLPSYNRFVELMPRVLLHLVFFLYSHKGKMTGISFLDSTPIRVCNIKRAKRNKVFENVATFGKTTIGWFYGFKLHIIINEVGELLAFRVTTANTDDRKPVDDLTKDILGKCMADKGYISQALFEKLLQRGLQLVTSVKKNMKNKMMPMIDKILLRKRSLIETVNDQLKNVCHAEHSRHRSVLNFMVNMVSALISYARQEKKPKMNFDFSEIFENGGEDLPILI
jgi:Transposase DDE domain